MCRPRSDARSLQGGGGKVYRRVCVITLERSAVPWWRGRGGQGGVLSLCSAVRFPAQDGRGERPRACAARIVLRASPHPGLLAGAGQTRGVPPA